MPAQRICIANPQAFLYNVKVSMKDSGFCPAGIAGNLSALQARVVCAAVQSIPRKQPLTAERREEDAVRASKRCGGAF